MSSSSNSPRFRYRQGSSRERKLHILLPRNFIRFSLSFFWPTFPPLHPNFSPPFGLAQAPLFPTLHHCSLVPWPTLPLRCLSLSVLSGFPGNIRSFAEKVIEAKVELKPVPARILLLLLITSSVSCSTVDSRAGVRCSFVSFRLHRKPNGSWVLKMQTRYMERSNSVGRGKRGLDSSSVDEGQPNRKRPALAR